MVKKIVKDNVTFDKNGVQQTFFFEPKGSQCMNGLITTKLNPNGTIVKRPISKGKTLPDVQQPISEGETDIQQAASKNKTDIQQPIRATLPIQKPKNVVKQQRETKS